MNLQIRKKLLEIWEKQSKLHPSIDIKKYIIIGVSSFFGFFLATFLFLFFAVSFTKGGLIESFIHLVPQKPLHGVNIIAVGVDETKIVKRSDTIIVLHLDKEKNRIGALSVPRDTRANIPGVGISKINHSYAHGGIKLLQHTVSSFLNIPIHYYIKIDLQGIEDIVNKLGGLELNVEKGLHYNDNAGNLHININKGKQVLKGKDASAYLRFRHDKEGDIGRIRRQQYFLKSITKKILSSGKLYASSKLFKILAGSVDTDLSIGQIISFTKQFSRAFELENIDTGSIPGAVTLISGVSYWRPDIIGMDKLIENVLFGFGKSSEENPFIAMIKEKKEPEGKQKTNQEAKEIKVAEVKTEIKKLKPLKKKKEEKTIGQRKLSINEVSKITERVAIKDVVSQKGAKDDLKLEILNGNGTPGIAQKMARVLKQKGFQVARFDNSGSFKYETTLLVDWKGNIQNALILADFLAIEATNIIVYDRPNKKIDVTIVLGKDWEALLEEIAKRKENNEKSG